MTADCAAANVNPHCFAWHATYGCDSCLGVGTWNATVARGDTWSFWGCGLARFEKSSVSRGFARMYFSRSGTLATQATGTVTSGF